jgi:hypothetical protein
LTEFVFLLMYLEALEVIGMLSVIYWTLRLVWWMIKRARNHATFPP